MERQLEYVLRTVEERGVRFVRLWFTDVLGFLKSVAVAPAELEGAFAEGIGFDGSAIEGFSRVHESDMLAKPDPATFQLLPAFVDLSKHNPVLQALSGPAVLLVWLYLMANVIVFGAEVNWWRAGRANPSDSAEPWA